MWADLGKQLLMLLQFLKHLHLKVLLGYWQLLQLLLPLQETLFLLVLVLLWLQLLLPLLLDLQVLL